LILNQYPNDFHENHHHSCDRSYPAYYRRLRKHPSGSIKVSDYVSSRPAITILGALPMPVPAREGELRELKTRALILFRAFNSQESVGLMHMMG
jgi:hypothetical protein